jgi:hypothetical protein
LFIILSKMQIAFIISLVSYSSAIPIANSDEFHPEGRGPDHNEWENGDQAVLAIAATAAAVGGCMWFTSCRGAVANSAGGANKFAQSIKQAGAAALGAVKRVFVPPPVTV